MQRSSLESNIVRLRAQVERGETTRQNLEYELTLAKKATNQIRRIAAEKDVETTNNVALLKDHLSETKTRLAGIEQELANTKNIRKNETGQWKKHLQTKVNFYLYYVGMNFFLKLSHATLCQPQAYNLYAISRMQNLIKWQPSLKHRKKNLNDSIKYYKSNKSKNRERCKMLHLHVTVTYHT